MRHLSGCTKDIEEILFFDVEMPNYLLFLKTSFFDVLIFMLLQMLHVSTLLLTCKNNRDF